MRVKIDDFYYIIEANKHIASDDTAKAVCLKYRVN